MSWVWTWGSVRRVRLQDSGRQNNSTPSAPPPLQIKRFNLGNAPPTPLQKKVRTYIFLVVKANWKGIFFATFPYHMQKIQNARHSQGCPAHNCACVLHKFFKVFKGKLWGNLKSYWNNCNCFHLWCQLTKNIWERQEHFNFKKEGRGRCGLPILLDSQISWGTKGLLSKQFLFFKCGPEGCTQQWQRNCTSKRLMHI